MLNIQLGRDGFTAAFQAVKAGQFTDVQLNDLHDWLVEGNQHKENPEPLNLNQIAEQYRVIAVTDLADDYGIQVDEDDESDEDCLYDYDERLADAVREELKSRGMFIEEYNNEFLVRLDS